MDEDAYDGIPVDELPITAVDVPNQAHLLRRSARYPGERDIDPAAATGAALDPHALIARDPSSRTREAILVVGFTPTADQVLVVVLLPDGMSSPLGRPTGAGTAPTGTGSTNDTR